MKLFLTVGIVTCYLLVLLFIKQNEAAECSSLQKINYTSSYTTRGQLVTKAGMFTYETGNLTSNKILIAVYDIYGFLSSTNIFQVCDTLGDLGYKVVMPDFFHGIPWKRDHYPFPKDQAFNDFVKATSWDQSVKADLGLVLEVYKAESPVAVEFGIFGFCFGGKISAHAVGEYSEDIKVAAQFHPAGANITDAQIIKRPTLLMPGANDPDMTEYCEIINTNLGAGSCMYHHFRDVNHGYSGGTGDWTNETIRGRAEEAIGMLEQFLCDKFPAQ